MLFSVIVPAFNAGNTLKRTLDSLVCLESNEDVEIIVINDGSTDDTEVVAQTYSKSIRYLYQSNKGVSAARNLGARIAKGEWLIFIDADDEACINRASAIKVLLGDRPTVDLIISDQYFVKESGECIETNFARAGGMCPDIIRSIGRQALVDQTEYASLIQFGMLEVRALTVRTSLFSKVGGFPIGVRIGEDLIFGIRLLAFARGVLLLNDPLAKYYIRSDSVLRTDPIAANLYFLAALDDFQHEVINFPVAVQAGYSRKLRQVVLDACNILIRANRQLDAVLLVSRMLFRRRSAMKIRDFVSVLVG